MRVVHKVLCRETGMRRIIAVAIRDMRARARDRALRPRRVTLYRATAEALLRRAKDTGGEEGALLRWASEMTLKAASGHGARRFARF